MAADGTWNIVIDTPMGQREANLQLSTAGGTLSGTQSADGVSGEIREATMSGNDVGWKIDITDPMSMTLEFAGTIDGDNISGNVQAGMFGSFPFSGHRA